MTKETNKQKVGKRIALLKGELQGLEFAYELMADEDVAPRPNSATPKQQTPKPTPPASSKSGKTPSVRAHLVAVVRENPLGLRYSELVTLTSKKAGHVVNKKTVSSSLDTAKKRGEVIGTGGIYKPGVIHA